MLKIIKTCLLSLSIVFISTPSFVFSQKKAAGDKNKDDRQKGKYKPSAFSGLKFRSIGPATTSGRIADLAVNPGNPAQYYVAAASGGVWKTDNAGTTYYPVFDEQGSYSIGCVAMDPGNENTVWAGTGENNNQRSVAYGNGVYKSEDGGKSWKNMGLRKSEHIGKIIVAPLNSNIVYVAAMGPLWNEGGERGLYKTTDGGGKWERVLHIDDHTGISDIVMDPRSPDVVYAAAQQRRRHVFTYIGGGPGSGIHKTTDGGKTWNKSENGLPSEEMGRIGLAISPVNPDYIYAIIEAVDAKGGFFRSTNRGASWNKMSDYVTSGNYYQKIYCDPKDINKVFVMDTWLHHTEDGGKTFKKTGEKSKHVDNHAMWIDMLNTNHWILGCDGGLYETWDHAENWQFKPNLPVTQFYKVALDNSYPFYFVYGGTQDNNTLGGPSRTINNSGITNSDWFITNGGDGFEPAVDPKNPDIVYGQSQYGWLVRYDKKSGETVGIKPQEGKGEAALRWNWDSPLIISPHDNKRLYFAANKLFRSDERGDSWTAISGDLTRQTDRNKLKVMGRVWSMDAVMKNQSTTVYGNIVALAESPVQENLLYVGTDDGLIHVTEDAGKNWRKIETFPGVPDMTYVNDIVASQHNANVVYAAFNNHKRGDFKPYILKSSDKGITWQPVHGNLPEIGSVYALAEDHKNQMLLFSGTEFGLFFSADGGKEWTQLKSGIPTIAIRDIEIQERENDLVLASFGRGFYILDDYSPLRTLSDELFKKEAHIFPVKDALMFIDARPLGGRGKSDQGESFYTAENPPLGAVFTYLFRDSLKTKREQRLSAEKKLSKEGKDVYYPLSEEIRAEDQEPKPYFIFTITDEQGEVVRKIKSDAKSGINRIVWDFRYEATTPVELKTNETDRYSEASTGPLAMPGRYFAAMEKNVNGEATQLVEPKPFNCVLLNVATLPAKDKKELLAFQHRVNELRRAVRATAAVKSETDKRIEYIMAAIEKTPGTPAEMTHDVKMFKQQMYSIGVRLNGDQSLARREFEVAPSITDRVEIIIWNMWRSTASPTKTDMDSYRVAAEEFEPLLADLKELINRIRKTEEGLDKYKAPHTPGRLPVWNNN